MKRTLILALAVTVSSMGMAQSITMATFADPSNSSANPLVQVDENAFVVTAFWNQPGMTLETPGFIGGGSVANAQMLMNPVVMTPVVPGVYSLGSGNVTFTDAVNNLVMNASFDGGLLVIDGGFGSSDLRFENVSFTGPLVPSGLTSEMFNFSFANRDFNGQTFITSYTASFTSSAVVPEPASMIALGAGLVALAGRRRRK